MTKQRPNLGFGDELDSFNPTALPKNATAISATGVRQKSKALSKFMCACGWLRIESPMDCRVLSAMLQ